MNKTYTDRRIHGYWERMGYAEGRLLDYWQRNRATVTGYLCLLKAQELSDRRDSYWNKGAR